MKFKLKDLLLKVRNGEELSAEEEEAIETADTEAEEAEVGKQVKDVLTKFVEELDAKYAPKVVEEDAISKETVEKMTKEEKLNTFFKAVIRNDIATLKYLDTVTPGNGGYLVPDEAMKEVLNFLGIESTIRANATIINNCPASYDVSAFATLPTAYFRSEAGLKPKSKPTFSQQTLTPYSVSVLCALTNELKADAMIDIAGQVMDSMKEALIVKEEEVFASGNGTGLPTGLENYYAAYPAARKVTAATYLSFADRIMAADTRLQKRYRSGAKWYMSTEQLEVVRTLKDKNDRYLFQDDLTGDYVGRISGKPVEVNDSLTNVWFGDMKSYWIGQRGGIEVAVSSDATITNGESVINLFEQNMFALRVEERIDGELVNNRGLIAVAAGEIAS